MRDTLKRLKEDESIMVLPAEKGYASVVMDTYHTKNKDVNPNQEWTLPAPQQRPNRPSDPEVAQKAANLEVKRISIRGCLQRDQTSSQKAA